MREIKFRAWEPNRKQMFVDVTVESSQVSPRCVKHGGIDCLEMLPLDWVELMQYTGLKDKNGKEIYEGDIVRTHPIPHEFNPVREPCVVQISPYGGVQLYINNQLCAYTVEDSTEVIGNIYENPKLLEVKK